MIESAVLAAVGKRLHDPDQPWDAARCAVARRLAQELDRGAGMAAGAIAKELLKLLAELEVEDDAVAGVAGLSAAILDTAPVGPPDVGSPRGRGRRRAG